VEEGLETPPLRRTFAIQPEMPSKLSPQVHEGIPAWNIARMASLFKGIVEDITKEQPSFFGSVNIEINYRQGEIETVAVNRRQTFKD
jgi:hypothetical protein